MRIATSASRIARSSSVSSSSSEHRHIGVGFEERVQPRRQPGRAEPDRGRDLQPSGRLFLAFRQQRLGHRQLGEHLADRAVQRFALLGQDQTARVTMEQRHLQRFLQRRDLPARQRTG